MKLYSFNGQYFADKDIMNAYRIQCGIKSCKVLEHTLVINNGFETWDDTKCYGRYNKGKNLFKNFKNIASFFIKILNLW